MTTLGSPRVEGPPADGSPRWRLPRAGLSSFLLAVSGLIVVLSVIAMVTGAVEASEVLRRADAAMYAVRSHQRRPSFVVDTA